MSPALASAETSQKEQIENVRRILRAFERIEVGWPDVAGIAYPAGDGGSVL